MSQRDDLMRGICEEPADDLRRLIFADWCEENGETDLAEFIRLSLTVKREEIKPLHWYDLLRKRPRFSGLDNCTRWASPLSPLHIHQWTAAHTWFSRGFVVTAKCSYSRWMEFGHQVIERLPIEEVVLEDKRPFAMPMADSDGDEYGWEVDSSVTDQRKIPPALVGCFRGVSRFVDRTIGGYARTFVVFASRYEAQFEMAVACLRFARSKAGLPDMIIVTS